MEKQSLLLDILLVPGGLLALVAYHIWLLRRVVNHPTTTVIGINSINRRLWVQAMMDDPSKNGILAIQTLRNNMMASTLLASTAIMLSSIIAVLMTHASSSSRDLLFGGSQGELMLSLKFFFILICFIVAFLLNVQSIRYYSHAGILITVPRSCENSSGRGCFLNAEEYVDRTVNRGSYFWSMGLRAYYFTLPLFLWVFGPIPMFLSSLTLLSLLYFLDVTNHNGKPNVAEAKEEVEVEDMQVVTTPEIQSAAC